MDSWQVCELREGNGRYHLIADIKSPEERSLNMARIRSKDTKSEIWLRKKLFAKGYRYRKNVKNVKGHPDAWFSRYNIALFIHGCFWHRHKGGRYAYMPKSRIEFWTDKFQKNVERDQTVRNELEAARIKMLIIWECMIKQMMRQEQYSDEVLYQIEDFL